jgi:hypothetical protein
MFSLRWRRRSARGACGVARRHPWHIGKTCLATHAARRAVALGANNNISVIIGESGIGNGAIISSASINMAAAKKAMKIMAAINGNKSAAINDQLKKASMESVMSAA